MYGVSHGAEVSRMSAVRRMLIFFIELLVFMGTPNRGLRDKQIATKGVNRSKRTDRVNIPCVRFRVKHCSIAGNAWVTSAETESSPQRGDEPWR